MNALNEETQAMNKTQASMLSNILEDKASKRIYVTKLCTQDLPHIIKYLDDISSKNGATKIIVKVPTKYSPFFNQYNYQLEAYIPAYFADQTDVLFMCKYTQKERQQAEKHYLGLLQNMCNTLPSTCTKSLNQALHLRELCNTDIPNMISVFKQVFETYPFPIFETDFLQQSMLDGTRYFGVFEANKLVAVSSAECDAENKNAEMTDFAVLPSHRGMCLASHLLIEMEHALRKDKYVTVYTIARLQCMPMNKTFYNAQYQYTGTLIQNTQISGSIQSMNVWYKRL